MSITASDKGGSIDFEPAPAGNHPARCVSIIDLGTTDQEYMGEVSSKHQVFIMFELPTKMKTYKKDGEEVTEPFAASGFYTLSLNEKANLTALLEGWRGKQFTDDEKAKFDISVLASKPCLLNVIRYTKQNGKPGAKIGSASQLPDGIECLPQVNPTVIFSLEDFDQKVFDNLSDGLKKMVMKSDEYVALHQPKEEVQESENPVPGEVGIPAPYDDIPF